MLNSHRSPTYLAWFGLLSVLIHGAAWVIWNQTWQGYFQQPERSDPSVIPVDYIEIPPELASDTPPDEAEFQASRDSIAGGTFNPNRPLSTVEGLVGTSRTPSSSSSGTPQQARPLPPPVIEEEPQERDRPPLTREEILSRLDNPEVFDPTSPVFSGESLYAEDSPLSQPSEPQVGNTSTNGTLNVEGEAVQPGVNAQATPNLAPYIDAMRQQVRQAWVPSGFQTSLQTVVEFSIQRDGQINEPRVIESSGIDDVDQGAIAAIQAAAPFAPLPETYEHSTLTIHFSFTITAW